VGRRTAILSHRSSLAHNRGAAHPECAERIGAAMAALEKEFKGNDDVVWVDDAPKVSDEDVLKVHSVDMLSKLIRACALAGDDAESSVALDADTSVTSQSLEAARRAAGAVIECVKLVSDTSSGVKNGFCVVRPPGHHATPTQSMGFCLLNSIGIGARFARDQLGLERVAIVDFDVHHGNGTQDIFYDDPQTLFISTHQSPLYPGTGRISDFGIANNICNLPSPSMSSKEFRAIFQDIVVERVRQFKPNIIMVSAGFDAHMDDPLASFELSEKDFQFATGRLAQLSEELTCCNGRLVTVLEGGYNLDALARSCVAHVHGLIAPSLSNL
jgi:acetoin utilization deacetylase AcuC-like enzyme